MVIDANPAARRGLAGLILAAGSGSRFGGPKQLELLGGVPLVVRAARLAGAICDAGVVVVTGAAHRQVVDALQGEPARAVFNPAWAEGMGASLRQGVSALPADIAGILVLLADQAAVDRADLDRLRAAWRLRPGQPAAAAFENRIAAPAIFPADWRGRFAALHGDQGARRLLRAGPVTEVSMASAALDVDTPDDLARISAGV